MDPGWLTLFEDFPSTPSASATPAEWRFYGLLLEAWPALSGLREFRERLAREYTPENHDAFAQRLGQEIEKAGDAMAPFMEGLAQAHQAVVLEKIMRGTLKQGELAKMWGYGTASSQDVPGGD